MIDALGCVLFQKVKSTMVRHNFFSTLIIMQIISHYKSPNLTIVPVIALNVDPAKQKQNKVQEKWQIEAGV